MHTHLCAGHSHLNPFDELELGGSRPVQTQLDPADPFCAYPMTLRTSFPSGRPGLLCLFTPGLSSRAIADHFKFFAKLAAQV